jgi:hypothetical protein
MDGRRDGETMRFNLSVSLFLCFSVSLYPMKGKTE